jgi:hypothetical protein
MRCKEIKLPSRAMRDWSSVKGVRMFRLEKARRSAFGEIGQYVIVGKYQSHDYGSGTRRDFCGAWLVKCNGDSIIPLIEEFICDDPNEAIIRAGLVVVEELPASVDNDHPF